MDEATIKDRIAGYRSSKAEWLSRRAAALKQAEECMAHANGCAGAIEALEGLLPAVPVEDIVTVLRGSEGQ